MTQFPQKIADKAKWVEHAASPAYAMEACVAVRASIERATEEARPKRLTVQVHRYLLGLPKHASAIEPVIIVPSRKPANIPAITL
jgi:hypothetical protein